MIHGSHRGAEYALPAAIFLKPVRKIIEREDIASSGNARSAQPREDETYVDFVS